MQRRDVLAFDFVDGEFTEFRLREFLNQPAPARDGLRLTAHLDMLNEVAPREFSDRWGCRRNAPSADLDLRRP